MKCDKCNRVLRNDWEFCPSCGNSLRIKRVYLDESDIDIIEKSLKKLKKEIKNTQKLCN